MATKEIAIERVYYKENRAVLKRGNKYILRNTWTGEEKFISKNEAMKFKKDWIANETDVWN
jgi:hypothetical protein